MNRNLIGFSIFPNKDKTPLKIKDTKRDDDKKGKLFLKQPANN